MDRWSVRNTCAPDWRELDAIIHSDLVERRRRRKNIAVFCSIEGWLDRPHHRRLYIAVDGEKPIGLIELSRHRRKWPSWQVAYAYVRPSWRGKGVGKLLYETILDDGIILISGDSQTQKSRAVWNYLAQNDAYTVYAIDLRRPQRGLTVDYDEENRQMILPEGIEEIPDWRLVAVRSKMTAKRGRPKWAAPEWNQRLSD